MTKHRRAEKRLSNISCNWKTLRIHHLFVKEKPRQWGKPQFACCSYTVSARKRYGCTCSEKNFTRCQMRNGNSLFIANISVADIFFAIQNIPHAYNHRSVITMVTANLTILAIALLAFVWCIFFSENLSQCPQFQVNRPVHNTRRLRGFFNVPC